MGIFKFLFSDYSRKDMVNWLPNYNNYTDPSWLHKWLIHIVWVTGLDVKHLLLAVDVNIDEYYKIKISDINKMLKLLDNIWKMIEEWIWPKSWREFKEILSIDKKIYTKINAKEFTYKLYKKHAELIHNLVENNRYDIDMQIMKKLYWY